MMSSAEVESDFVNEYQILSKQVMDISSNKSVFVSAVMLAEFDIDKGSSITCCKVWDGHQPQDYVGKVSINAFGPACLALVKHICNLYLKILDWL